MNFHPDFRYRVAAIIRSILKHYNLSLWQNEHEVLTQVVGHARHIMDEWVMKNTMHSPSRQHQEIGHAAVVTHQPAVVQEPSAGTRSYRDTRAIDLSRFDLNATLMPHFCLRRTEICFRDEEGAYMLAKTMSFSPMISVNIGEALALFHALQWLQDTRFDNVDFVVDSKITADTVILRRRDITEFGQIIAACQDISSSYFTNFRVEFHKRQANMVAHALACEAIDIGSPVIYFKIPDCIDTLIMNEMQ